MFHYIRALHQPRSTDTWKTSACDAAALLSSPHSDQGSDDTQKTSSMVTMETGDCDSASASLSHKAKILPYKVDMLTCFSNTSSHI